MLATEASYIQGRFINGKLAKRVRAFLLATAERKTRDCLVELKIDVGCFFWTVKGVVEQLFLMDVCLGEQGVVQDGSGIGRDLRSVYMKQE